MRVLYLDCGMGAAGDMLTAALVELLEDPDAFLQELNSIGLPGIQVIREKSVKCGITGSHIRVLIGDREEGEYGQHGHSHNDLTDIRKIVGRLSIPTMVKLDILAVYQEIAEAESQVHGVPVEQIHFHEVGALDAVADITAVCLLMDRLDVDRIVASPVHVGSGTVRCAHGILPVPAPATARILQGVPIYGGRISGELCTPTGAALLKHFVSEFGDMPIMQVDSIGYGMGKKDFERANCVRAMLGRTEKKADRIAELRCNVDDMTGEAVGYALEYFMDQGALDAFTTPIGMKKSRPGIMITVLCRESEKEKFAGLLLRHTTTLGVRETLCSRYTLERHVETVDTPWGSVRKKISEGYGVRREKYEYADLARIAREQGIGIGDVEKALK